MSPALSDVPPLLGAVWLTLVGAVVGSFLNVVIARVPAGLSVVRPASRCPGCGTPIAWYDNVPVLSWLLLRARCRTCQKRISFRYPLVELLGGAAGWLAHHRHGLSPEAGAELVLVATLLALAFIDLDTWLLPYALTVPLIGTGLAAGVLGWSPAGGLGSAALGAAAGFGAFAAVAWGGEKLLGKEALGWGDVWLLGGLGAWLGGLPLLPVVLLASIQGSVVGIALVLAGRAQPGPGEGEAAPAPAPSEAAAAPAPSEPAPAPSEAAAEEAWVPPRHAVPFGPFLVAGAVEWLYLAAPLGDVVPALQLFR